MGGGTQQLGGPTGMGTPGWNPNAQMPQMGMPGQPPMGGPPQFPPMGGMGGGGPLQNILQLIPMALAARGGGQAMGAFANTKNVLGQQKLQQQQQAFDNQARQQQIGLQQQQVTQEGERIGLLKKQDERAGAESARERAKILASDPAAQYDSLTPEEQASLTRAQFVALQKKASRMDEIDKLTLDIKREELRGTKLDTDAKLLNEGLRRSSNMAILDARSGKNSYASLDPETRKAISESDYQAAVAQAKQELETKDLTVKELRSRIAANVAQAARANIYSLGATDTMVDSSGKVIAQGAGVGPGGGVGTKPMSEAAATRLALVSSAKSNIGEFRKMLEKNFRATVLGIASGTDREASLLYSNISDQLGRLRSQGAVTADEEARFKDQLGASIKDVTFGSSAESVEQLDRILKEFEIVEQRITGEQSAPAASPQAAQEFDYVPGQGLVPRK